MGYIQRLVEERGIRTASIMHLPKVARKTRPPRMLTIGAPLGLTFGEAFEKEKHEKVFMELLELSINGGLEEERPSNYN